LRRGYTTVTYVKTINGLSWEYRPNGHSRVALALVRLAKQMSGVRELLISLDAARTFDLTHLPVLETIPLSSHHPPSPLDVVGILERSTHLRCLELGSIRASHDATQLEQQEDLELQAWWAGPTTAVDAHEASVADHDETDDETEDDTGPLQPMTGVHLDKPLFEHLADHVRLTHLKILDHYWLTPTFWSVGCAFPQLAHIAIGCTEVPFATLTAFLVYFAPTLRALQLDVSQISSTYWTAHNTGSTLPPMDRLEEVDLVHYGGGRIYGPVRRVPLSSL
jgi:hypothetical protein